MDSDDRRILDRLGAQLIQEIRDEALDYLQKIVRGEMIDQRSKSLHARYNSASSDAAATIRRFVVVAVDACLARLMNYLDQHAVPLSIETEDKKKVDARALSDGLVGELYNETGWIARFSRYSDQVQQ